MKVMSLLAALGFGLGCANTATVDGDAMAGDAPVGGDAACVVCLVDPNCNGSVCAQFGGDTYCAVPCPGGSACGAGSVCTAVTTVSGDPTNVCVPDACGGSVPVTSFAAGSRE